jgi:hypothetical protein
LPSAWGRPIRTVEPRELNQGLTRGSVEVNEAMAKATNSLTAKRVERLRKPGRYRFV